MRLEQPVVIQHAHGGTVRTDRFEDVATLAAAFNEIVGVHTLSRLAYRDARVMLGHWLNTIDKQIAYRERGSFYEAIGIHPRTARSAKQLAERIADPTGRIDFSRVRTLLISRAESVQEGVPVTREERALIEQTAETLTSTDLEVLVGVRGPERKDERDDEPYTPPNRTEKTTVTAPPCRYVQPTPAGDGRDGPLAVAGTPAMTPLKLAGTSGGASGEQMSFDWDRAQDHANTLSDWCWQRRDELDEDRKARIAALLAEAVKVFDDLDAEMDLRRRTRMSDKANEIGDLMESGRSKFR